MSTTKMQFCWKKDKLKVIFVIVFFLSLVNSEKKPILFLWKKRFIKWKMWANNFNKKSATNNGGEALGDFAHVKQQLQKIRASTRLSSRRSTEDSLRNGNTRPLPPLPPHHNSNGGGVGAQGNKSVRFNIPDGGLALPSGSEGSDQGYESDQSRVSWFPIWLQTFISLG